jgi:hypothetical protein
MKTFNKPQNLNGEELKEELRNAGVEIAATDSSVQLNGDGLLVLEIKDSDEEKAASVVAAHNGTTIAAEPTIEEKLLSVGLTVEDLKAALGL